MSEFVDLRKTNLQENIAIIRGALEMQEFRKKQLAVMLIADTLNPIAMMDLAETIKQMANDRDKELYDGSQLRD
tara:strand:- start:2680 stop:2901 length:222 start_codon:yes stop_codon:yes gene_type:complete